MDNKKPRLSDVTKKNTTDRASKLAGAFLPPPPVVTPVASPPVETAPQESLQDKIDQTETDFAEGKGVTMTTDRLQNLADQAPAAKPLAPERPKERTRRSSQSIDIAEMVNHPAPEGLRCTRMIMLSDDHHDMLRELQFKFKKPMTVLLYNLLEPAFQALQREKKKGD